MNNVEFISLASFTPPVWDCSILTVNSVRVTKVTELLCKGRELRVESEDTNQCYYILCDSLHLECSLQLGNSPLLGTSRHFALASAKPCVLPKMLKAGDV